MNDPSGGFHIVQRHRLVTELVPDPVLPGWFGDGVHLEVWTSRE